MITALKLASRSLRSNVGRTVLSLLGIVIGIVSVIMVLSLGAGVREFVIGQVESFGTDIVQMEIKVPATRQTSAQNAAGLVGGTQITTMSIEDAEAVADRLPNISDWYAGMLGQEVANHEGKQDRVFIFGVTSGVIGADPQFDIEEGSMFSDDDDKNLERVVVLGSEVKNDFFGTESAVGKRIKIKGQNYRVIGVAEERGGSGFFNFDDLIYMPLRTLQKRIQGIDHIQFAIFKIKDTARTELTVLEITDIMRDRHEIDDPVKDDFAVMSIAEARDILDTVFSTLNLLLIALTSISLVVGGVGIMNVMYVSVVERTYEIGLRKAVGAKRSGILAQFLFEAIFLTLLGGIVGIIFGAVLAYAASVMAGRFGFAIDFPVTAQAVLISVGFSVATGLFFGFQPARKASRISPMEALRYE